MIYKKRLYQERLQRMAGQFPILVLSGARQVGKSTLLQHAFPEWERVVFDPVVDIGNARAEPELFLSNHPPPLILDEIQYAPELVPVIKRRVDESKKPGQYILTGSQQWSVIRSASESLAGRAAFMDMEGFCLSELSEAPTSEHWLKRYLDAPEAFIQAPPRRLPLERTLSELLWRGFLPEADAVDQEWLGDFHRSYLRTYVERDVRLMADIADWQQFGRFNRLLAALSAQEINYSQLGREIGVTPQTAQRWLAILNATFQWFEVPAYHGNTVKRISEKPKGYFSDTGLACNLQMLSAPAALEGHPMAGAFFETAVAGEIRKLRRTISTPPNMYHWRSHGGAEVDLLLERDGRFFPLEIKLTARPTRAQTRGIQAFRNTYPHLNIAPGLVVCPCEAPLLLNEQDLAIPWDLQ